MNCYNPYQQASCTKVPYIYGSLLWAFARNVSRLLSIEAEPIVQIIASFFIRHGIESHHDCVDIYSIWIALLLWCIVVLGFPIVVAVALLGIS